MQVLDPQTVPLQHSNLIEASAGTGKTYTLSLLYLRFILESEPALSLQQMLVVTYTSAATKELKDRIRLRISEALRAFQQPAKAKGEYQQLCALFKDHSKALSRLKTALLNFDQASIFTIHSFCQRALKETAFDAALPFKTELLDNDHDLMQALVDDYWRINFYHAPAALLALLSTQAITPDSLLTDIRVAVGKPYLKRLKPQFRGDIGEQAQQLDVLYHHAIDTWQQSAEEISTLLRQHSGFYANVVKALDAMVAGMQTLSARTITTAPKDLPPKVEMLIVAKLQVKKNFAVIDHAFFGLWDDFLLARQQLAQSLKDYHNHLRNEVLDYLQQQLPLEKRRLGVMSFDDLLLQLQASLHKNPALAKLLANKYQVAMIDEFQDTDPVQYDVFQRIYGKSESSVVFFVGDPKQAIYSFRGADIYTYLKASQDTQQQYTLNNNWRSHPQFIKALNQLFSYGERPFYDANISYQTVAAGQPQLQLQLQQPSLTTPEARAPLRLWKLEDTEGKKKSELMDDIAAFVADDITRLLGAADEGKAHIATRPLEGGDIAVLVRSHRQGQQIKNALTERGIACVQSSKDSIFETHEAKQLLSVLLAIAKPSEEDQIRRALVSDFFAYRGDDLLHFDQDSNAWDRKLQSFTDWHQLWQTQGFMPMMRTMMRDEQVQAQLLSYANGERRLTNLLHLCELIHSESHQNSRGMEGTIRWLQQQSRHPTLSSDRLQLRLETDDKLVQIVTIHKSKGLEYGLIYCPYLWADSIKSASGEAAIMFHADDAAHTPSLDIGSAEREDHLGLLAQEAYAENMRLLYVALTRAKYHCTVVALTEKISRYIDRSALGWLLSDGVSDGANAKNKQFISAYQQTITALVSQSDGVIAAEPLPEPPAQPLHYQSKQSTPNLKARSFQKTIAKTYRISSFSGLTAGNHLQAHDHDASLLFHPTTTPHNSLQDDFPRGATAGSCLHDIYQHSDFTKPLSISTQEPSASAILRALDKWGFSDSLADSAHRLINNSLQAPLSPLNADLKLANLKLANLKLANISPAQRLNEMEFHLPLNAVLSVQALQQLLLQHLTGDKWQGVRNAIKHLDFEQLSGYLKGFIDLIFEYQGQYFVVDYKSNTLDNYAEDNMLTAIAESHYYLQYLIYSVALHRYLQQRIANYSYQSHFGGVYYLFIRGMSEEGQGAGVFYDLPEFSLIQALDKVF